MNRDFSDDKSSVSDEQEPLITMDENHRSGSGFDGDELERMLSIREAARLLGVSTATLRRFSNRGELACSRIGERGHRRFRKGDVLALRSFPSERGGHAAGASS